jgi:hypothetical protein
MFVLLFQQFPEFFTIKLMFFILICQVMITIVVLCGKGFNLPPSKVIPTVGGSIIWMKFLQSLWLKLIGIISLNQ